VNNDDFERTQPDDSWAGCADSDGESESSVDSDSDPGSGSDVSSQDSESQKSDGDMPKYRPISIVVPSATSLENFHTLNSRMEAIEEEESSSVDDANVEEPGWTHEADGTGMDHRHNKFLEGWMVDGTQGMVVRVSASPTHTVSFAPFLFRIGAKGTNYTGKRGLAAWRMEFPPKFRVLSF